MNNITSDSFIVAYHDMIFEAFIRAFGFLFQSEIVHLSIYF